MGRRQGHARHHGCADGPGHTKRAHLPQSPELEKQSQKRCDYLPGGCAEEPGEPTTVGVPGSQGAPAAVGPERTVQLGKLLSNRVSENLATPVQGTSLHERQLRAANPVHPEVPQAES